MENLDLKGKSKGASSPGPPFSPGEEARSGGRGHYTQLALMFLHDPCSWAEEGEGSGVWRAELAQRDGQDAAVHLTAGEAAEILPFTWQWWAPSGRDMACVCLYLVKPFSMRS